jgi:hypothetical protein
VPSSIGWRWHNRPAADIVHLAPRPNDNRASKMTPSLIAIGACALLLAWNDYLYAFLLSSRTPT